VDLPAKCLNEPPALPDSSGYKGVARMFAVAVHYSRGVILRFRLLKEAGPEENLLVLSS